MSLRVNGATEKFLTDLNRTQARLNDVQRQISSGLRVESPSDDPSAAAAILGTASRISRTEQAQTNLNQVRTELTAGDAALQQSLKLIQRAIVVGSQAGGSLDSSSLQSLADEVQGIQQQLVGVTQTSVNGRYIFSGDLDQQASYELDGAQPYGVRQVAAPQSTRVVEDASGNAVWTPKTASDIFDPTNADGSAASGNVFAAIHALRTALEANDGSAALAAVESLKAGDSHVNLQLASFGYAETRVDDALNTAAQTLTGLQQEFGVERDADAAGAAVELSQLGLQQQASLSVGARLAQRSLFDYLA